MNVTLFTFSKKHNSTAVPTGGTSVDVVLKDEAGVLDPIIELHTSASPSAYNYLYIPTFGRYYWLREWTYNRGIWTGSFTVDVLASWKSYILASQQYVLRADNNAALSGETPADLHKFLIDSQYPTANGATATQLYFDDIWGLGHSVVCGIAGYSDDTAFQSYSGITSYYAFTDAQMKAFLNWLFGTGTGSYSDDFLGWVQQWITQAATSAVRADWKPLEYITSAMWFPIPASQLPTVTVPYITYGTVSALRSGGVQQISSPPVWSSGTHTVSIPTHPGAPISGNDYWLNASPYTEYTLQLEPFGTYHLDSQLLNPVPRILARDLEICFYVDMMSGQGCCDVYLNYSTSSATGKSFVGRYYGQVGVPITVGGITNNMLADTAAAITDFTTSAQAGDVLGAMGAIGSGAMALTPRSTYKGSNGSTLPFALMPPCLIVKHNRITMKDTVSSGIPNCITTTLSNVTGYCKCLHGYVDAPATESELNSIEQFLTSGFYIA